MCSPTCWSLRSADERAESKLVSFDVFNLSASTLAESSFSVSGVCVYNAS